MRFDQLKRREFIMLLGGAGAWPIAARAQQPGRVPTVGVLVGLASTAEDPVAVESLRPFKDQMQKVGWIDGKNIHLVYRFGGGNLAKIEASAAELVALSPDLIYAHGLPATRAVHQKTSAIPIVLRKLLIPWASAWSRASRARAEM
jgi:putative tryptophan/tyrosine transport system substrate-binding protein